MLRAITQEKLLHISHERPQSVTQEQPHPLHKSGRIRYGNHYQIDYTLHKMLQAITQEKLLHIAQERPQSVTQERLHPLPRAAASVMQEQPHLLRKSCHIHYTRAAASITQERPHPLCKSGRCSTPCSHAPCMEWGHSACKMPIKSGRSPFNQ
jgi:hypothetical protein